MRSVMMRMSMTQDLQGYLFRFFMARWSEVAYIRLGLSGLQLEIEFPSDWHEDEECAGWVRIGLGFMKIGVAFPGRGCRRTTISVLVTPTDSTFSVTGCMCIGGSSTARPMIRSRYSRCRGSGDTGNIWFSVSLRLTRSRIYCAMEQPSTGTQQFKRKVICGLVRGYRIDDMRSTSTFSSVTRLVKSQVLGKVVYLDAATPCIQERRLSRL